jgi:hypothetical protein
VADKSIQLTIGALSQAVAHADGLPLFAGKTNPGLFPNNAGGKQAAQRCIEDGYIRCLQPNYTTTAAAEPAKKTKTPTEVHVITEKGFTFLFQQVSPRQVLEDLVRVLEQRQVDVTAMVQVVRQMQTGLDALKTNVEKILQTMQAGPGENGTPSGLANLFRNFRQEGPASTPTVRSASASPTEFTEVGAIQEAVRDLLNHWQTVSGASEDCTLPELYRQVRTRLPRLTIGQFHDVLRRLNDDGQIYLHPWTGPLYDLPEPPQALLVGHGIAYYASLRSETAATDSNRPAVVRS